MKKIPRANKAVALPLLGLLVTWAFFMWAILVDLYVPQPVYDTNGNATFSQEVIHWAPYLFLAGIAASAAASLVAQRWAIRARKEQGEDDPMARSAYRFTNLGLILSMAAGAIFAIGNFMSAFNTYGARAENIPLRIVNVYVPILLATGLVVYILLSAFTGNHEDKKLPKAERKVDETLRDLRRGYSIPIIATAIAIVFGLIVYDATKTNLQTWVWVIIIAIVGIGVTFGTHFASRAKTLKPKPAKTRSSLAAGAGYLNLVLSIVFGGVVSIMGFSLGGQAVDKLRVWQEVPADCKFTACNPVATLKWPSWQWLFEEMVPAKMLMILAVATIYLTITERNKQTASVKKTAPKKAAK